MRQSFKKKERLANKRIFDALFNTGTSLIVPPFKLIWSGAASIKTEAKTTFRFPIQLGISVPKKKFQKAVDRNKIKRRIREAYRKNKHLIYEFLQNKNLYIALVIIYIAKEEQSYSEIEGKMIVSLQKLMVQISR